MYALSVDSIVPKHGNTVHIDWDNVEVAGMSPQTITAVADIGSNMDAATISATAYVEGVLCTLFFTEFGLDGYSGSGELLVSTDLLRGTRYCPAITQYFPMDYSSGSFSPTFVCRTGTVKIEPSGAITFYSNSNGAPWDSGSYTFHGNCYTYPTA